MEKEMLNLISQLSKRDILDKDEFDKIINTMDCKFPEDYVEFMRYYNGGDGPILQGQSANFYSLEDLITENILYKFPEYWPNLFLIGSNKGVDAFVIRKSDGLLMAVPFIGDEEDGDEVGFTFLEFLRYLSKYLE